MHPNCPEAVPDPLRDSTYLAHQHWMLRAWELAEFAGQQGDVPVGAVIVDAQGHILAEAANRKHRDRNPVAHAEILALQQAAQQLGSHHLTDCTLYVTLEPCPMCAGAIIHAKVGLLVYGIDDPKAGAIRSVLNLPDSACSNHRLPVLGGILEQPCRDQLQSWFAQKRRPQSL